MSNDSFYKVIQNIFFQTNYTCNICGKEIFSGKYFCDKCESVLPRIDKNKCDHCGRVTFYAVKYCDSCVKRNINFDTARSVFDYVEPIDNLIKDFKYKGKRYLSEVFANELKNLYYSEFITADAIVYVPMTEERLNERGYNQAGLIAKELGEILNLPVLDNAIRKTRETSRQANLNKDERRHNLSKTFTAYKKEVNGKNLLLVDDVLTTGATADIIAEYLKKKGAKTVTVLTIASVQSPKLKPKNLNGIEE